MARVLVVSTQTMIGMSLQDEYDVTAVEPADLRPVVVDRGYDVSVLDAADVEATVQILAGLPRNRTGPVLLLAHDEQSAAALDAVKGLNDIRIGPPITGASLRQALHDLAPTPTREPKAAALEVAEPERTGLSKADVVASMHRDSGELARRLQGRHAEGSPLERAGTPVELLSLAQGLPVHPAEPEATQANDGREKRSSPRREPTATLVAALLERVPSMLSTEAVATIVAEDACQRLAAIGSAVLVGDGDRYVVVAGVGLRPLERRLGLTAEHWLVREVIESGHALIVEDTDIARRDLVGAPLAAAQHLLVVPLPDTGGLVIVARDAKGEPFTSTDVKALARLATEAGSPLKDALTIRELSRQLAALDAP